MNYAPIARILLRYLTGVSFGGAYLISEQIATDPEVIMIAASAIAGVVELLYAIAVKRGWAT